MLRYVLSLSIVSYMYTHTHTAVKEESNIVSLYYVAHYSESPSSLLFEALFGLELEADSFLLEGPSLLGRLPL